MTPSARRRGVRSPVMRGHQLRSSGSSQVPGAVEAVCDCVCICDGGVASASRSASSGTTGGGCCSGPEALT